MRIVIFTDSYPPFATGVATSSFNLANSLVDKGHDVLVVAPRPTDGRLEQIGNVLYVPGIYLKRLYGYRLTNIFTNKPISIIKKFKPDVIHDQTDFTIGVLARRCAKKLKLPIVYTYHTAYEDYTYYVTHGFMDKFAKKIVRNYAKDLSNKMTEFITPSEKIKNYMRLVGSDAYINVIPTGIDTSIFENSKIDPVKAEQFKKDHSIKPNTKVFLLVGRLAREKSMDVSLKCIAHYHSKYPERDIRVLILGEGPAHEDLELLCEELGISNLVDFLGEVTGLEVPFFYSFADIYTSASITETQGLTFMEAMAASKIVLARYDSNLEGTIINGKTGFFFTDEESFSEQVEKIFSLSEEEKANIVKEIKKVMEQYSIERFYSNTIRVYQRAVRKYW